MGKLFKIRSLMSGDGWIQAVPGYGLIPCDGCRPDPGQQPLGGISINVDIAVGRRMFYVG
ncbi:hypothetical protein [uncultured Desulfobacter sp.]|uniref:hypothetical protein n=1 Tax=uncultured Desulfobacter sp. TaxID=240139 RepID=UPI0029C8432E|nr:hypothetical protein [uncultured Desulfobacter sp.]